MSLLFLSLLMTSSFC